MKTGTPEYRTWAGMLRRCRNPNDPGYANYGGRGIRVCERWTSFGAFLTDMGPKPSPEHSIDRIDNNGHYEPGNCRWATQQQQAQNTRQNVLIRRDGETLCATEWSRRLGIPVNTIYRRHDQGIDIADPPPLESLSVSDQDIISAAMRALGSRRSEARAAASRANGRKGGRPRKSY